MTLPSNVKIIEVGPRDGLQNETTIVSIDTRVELVNRLTEAGLQAIEVGSFVSPKWVPKMANTDQVFKNIQRAPGVSYTALTPNAQGVEAAIAAQVSEVAVFPAASEPFSQKNLNCSIEQSLQRFEAVASQALAHKTPVRGYISCVLGCPYQGGVEPAAVLDIAHSLLAIGCYEISLGDTIGVGTPSQARSLVDYLAQHIPIEKLAIHFHDTYGQALANIYACLESGVSVVDSAVAGLGGCPYAKGSSGNVATEDVLYMLQGMNISTGIDLDSVIEAGQFISNYLKRPNQSKVATALLS